LHQSGVSQQNHGIDLDRQVPIIVQTQQISNFIPLKFFPKNLPNQSTDDSAMAEEKKAPPIGQKRVFDMEDLWALNEKFTSKLKRFVVKEARFPTDVKEDTAGVDAERKYAIESCIVRVMKSRKVYGHQDLINDVMKLLLKFSPDAKVKFLGYNMIGCQEWH
jgi:hypothetical protein